MCGRYYIEIDEKEILDIINEIEKNKKPSYEQITIKTSGEIFPTDIVPVRTGIDNYLPMKWGFTNYNGKPVINARSETAYEKPMFRKSMLEQRCLIPASGYYEWKKEDSKKIQYRLFIPDSPLYFAGCWRQENSSSLNTFVILTQEAAGTAEAIHDRMPVIMPLNLAGAWLDGDRDVIRAAIKELSFTRVG